MSYWGNRRWLRGGHAIFGLSTWLVSVASLVRFLNQVGNGRVLALGPSFDTGKADGSSAVAFGLLDGTGLAAQAGLVSLSRDLGGGIRGRRGIGGTWAGVSIIGRRRTLPPCFGPILEIPAGGANAVRTGGGRWRASCSRSVHSDGGYKPGVKRLVAVGIILHRADVSRRSSRGCGASTVQRR